MMSIAVRSRAGLWKASLTLLAGCAVAAPDAAHDPFFEENAHEGEQGAGDLDASGLDPALDPGPVDPGPIDSGNVLPPFGATGGATLGGAAGGTTGSAPPARDAGGGSTPTPGAGRDAGASRPPTPAGAPAAACDPFTCTNECSAAGPFPCCTLFDTCGCTWAPGAYCL